MAEGSRACVGHVAAEHEGGWWGLALFCVVCGCEERKVSRVV